MKNGIFFGLVITSLFLSGQTDSTKSKLTISGYVEAYYCYDVSNPSGHLRPRFIYSYNRHNEVNLNLGYVMASYAAERVRSNFAVMAGTYAQYNLARESPVFQHLFEGSVGVRLSKSKNLWLDGGVMPSHIGFESAVGKTSWNLTRSMLADNSPYYESGVKLGYTTKNDQLYLAVMYLNGWQRIQKSSGNQTPAFGTQLTYQPGTKLTFNWSTFVGNEYPDYAQRWRYFNNFYGKFSLSRKLGMIAGFDIGMQQTRKGSSAYDVWYAPVLIARYSASAKFSVSARTEYYSDPRQVIISTGTANGFRTYGHSINFDVAVTENIMWRIEARMLTSRDKIFSLSGMPSNNNYFATTSLAVNF